MERKVIQWSRDGRKGTNQKRENVRLDNFWEIGPIFDAKIILAQAIGHPKKSSLPKIVQPHSPQRNNGPSHGEFPLKNLKNDY